LFPNPAPPNLKDQEKKSFEALAVFEVQKLAQNCRIQTWFSNFSIRFHKQFAAIAFSFISENAIGFMDDSSKAFCVTPGHL
jgi:hypothetical protein